MVPRLKPDADNPDRLVETDGSFGGSLAGLFLLVAGGTAALSLAGVLPAYTADDTPLFFSAAAAIILGILLAGTGGVAVDRRHQEVLRWKGILGYPLRKETHSFAGAGAVTIGAEWWKDGYLNTMSSMDCPVKIGSLLFRNAQAHADAFALPRRLATFLSLPLVDQSQGAAIAG
jgi:hypothetical protein